MDRRKALRNMGLSMGYAVATPTLFSILQSCKNDKALVWKPYYFNPEQGDALIQLVDLILPKTNTPSASELQVHLFIDRYANEVLQPDQQALLKTTTDAFFKNALANAKAERIQDLSTEQLEKSLSEALKNTKEQEIAFGEKIATYQNALLEGKNATLDDKTACYAFANNLRNMTIWGYKGSEYIGEEVLAYLPVPGEYVACGDLEQLTNGKAWSL